jgi:hypothetical protein
MPASHFDVNSMTGRPKFIVRHSTCQKIVRKNLNFYPYKITTLQELRPDDSESRLEYYNWFLNNLNVDRFVIMN